MTAIQVSSAHRALIEGILERHLPLGTTVWVFGSRAKQTAKQYSDLDLAIEVNHPLDAAIMPMLMHDFEESTLPYAVDLLDWQTVSSAFQSTVDKDRILFWKKEKQL